MNVDRRRGLLEDAQLVPPWTAAAMDAWAEWVKLYRDGPGGGCVSPAYAMMQAKLLGVLPNPPLTEDQLLMLRHDNVVSGHYPGLGELGVTPHPLEAILPPYLTRYRNRG